MKEPLGISAKRNSKLTTIIVGTIDSFSYSDSFMIGFFRAACLNASIAEM